MTLTATQPAVLQRANKKAMRRLLPILILLLFVNYLDRVNVGFAAPTMNDDIGLTATTYGISIAVFFIGYVLLEIPSNYIMFRIGARKWLARIAISWGIVAALHAAVVNFETFALARVLLGIAEAGLLPGILLYISLWFTGRQRVTVLGIYYVAVPLATAIGGPLSNWLIHHGNETFGIEGWRFMFAIEGLAAVVLGIVVIFALPALPRDAKWLSKDEKTALEDASAAGHPGGDASHSFARALRSATTIKLSVIFLLLVFPMFAISFFLPLATSAIEGAGELAISIVTFIPFTLGAVSSFFWSRYSRRDLKLWHFTAPMVLASAAVLLCSFAGTSFPMLLTGISIAAIGIYGAVPIFWSIATGSLANASAAAGLALINTVGSIGGFVAGYFTGWFRDLTGAYQAPFIVMAISLVASGLLALVLLRRQRLSTQPLDVAVH